VILGTLLIYALFAGAAAWVVEWLLTRAGAVDWLVRILYGATLVYVFAVLVSNGPIQVGQ
jgi:hypothetical protein